MGIARFLVAGGALVAALASVSAQAQIFHDDDDGWCLWCFHRYGGDVNRPGGTPERPYWHGDDAVPLGLRWQDLAAARAEAAAVDAAAATVSDPLPAPAHLVPHRRHIARRSTRAVPVLVRKD